MLGQMDGGFLVFSLLFGVVWGIVAAAIASAKGRNVAGWFFGGFLGGLICVIVVACLSNLKTERRYRMQVEQANHRLREQLRQERIKTEAFREYSTSRLDAHDGALGMDTRAGGPMLEGGTSRRQLGSDNPADALNRMAADVSGEVGAQSPPTQATGAQAADASPVWFYVHAGQSCGPVTKASIEKMLRERTLTRQSLLWAEGMVDWLPVSDLAAFANSGVL